MGKTSCVLCKLAGACGCNIKGKRKVKASDADHFLLERLEGGRQRMTRWRSHAPVKAKQNTQHIIGAFPFISSESDVLTQCREAIYLATSPQTHPIEIHFQAVQTTERGLDGTKNSTILGVDKSDPSFALVDTSYEVKQLCVYFADPAPSFDFEIFKVNSPLVAPKVLWSRRQPRDIPINWGAYVARMKKRSKRTSKRFRRDSKHAFNLQLDYASQR